MSNQSTDDAASSRVDAQVQRNAERLSQRYSTTSEPARRSFAVRERYVQARVLRRSA